MDKDLPPIIRVSIRSAIRLGLTKGAIDTAPTTVSLLSYIKAKCLANFAFCSQARESSSRADMLSRITWPPFFMEQVVYSIAQLWSIGRLERTCIQTVNHPRIFQETLATVQAIRNTASIPISVSCIPFSKEEMEQLRETGVERIGIPLDAATKELFAKIKGNVVGGPYRWDDHIRALKHAVAVFGNGKVSTHLMVGLGEMDRDLMSTVQFMTNMGVYPSLFAFTPVPGSTLEKTPQPDLRRYHRIQLAHHLIMKGISNFDKMSFGY